MQHLESGPTGRVVCNRSGVITGRGPDSVRGPDISYYSYALVSRGRLPLSYLPVPPDLVFEVRSTDDRWREVHVKVGEYLEAGVTLVCVLDQQTESAHVFHSDQPPRLVTADQELTLPEVLPDFRVPVRRFFE